ncbi:MAG: ribonuclease III [Candidatus Cloacimonetes bacterium]|nr:ribonuclease III [Candidatus Cloacimonadota bacterium]
MKSIIKTLLAHFSGDAPELSELKDFQLEIDYQFTKPEILKAALSHTSAFTSDNNDATFERMEFLGDSILGLIVAEEIFIDNPQFSEGQLSKLKSKIVSKKFLYQKAKEIALTKFLKMSQETKNHAGRESQSISADAMESLICAIYLDGGIKAARKFIRRFILKDYKQQIKQATLMDYKSILQEYTQSEFQTLPVYRIIAETGPEHAKNFQVEVYIKNEKIGSGNGPNKKQAHQNAARQACLKYNL